EQQHKQPTLAAPPRDPRERGRYGRTEEDEGDGVLNGFGHGPLEVFGFHQDRSTVCFKISLVELLACHSFDTPAVSIEASDLFCDASQRPVLSFSSASRVTAHRWRSRVPFSIQKPMLSVLGS